MKYLNRQRLGIEAFLASRSSVFSRHNELDPDEFIARLRVQPYTVRSRVADDVRSAITELKSGRYDVGSLVPPHIEALTEDQCSAERVGKMRPFFVWLRSLWRDNDQARTEWISSLKTVARNLSAASGECLMAVSMGYNNQRALLQQKGDGSLELSLHERRWGRLSLEFPNCSLSDEQSVPALGFVYMIEGEVIENDRYRFEILFDTEFFPAGESIRALKTNSWQQVEFTSDAPKAKIHQVNYAMSAEIRGASRLETVRYSSEVLCEKLSLAGEAMLSAGERTALSTARLISATKTLADKGREGDARSEDILLELAENRYALEQMAELFRNEKAEPLGRLLEKAIEYMDAEDDERVLAVLKKLPALMDSLCAEGELMPLLLRLDSMMKRAGECEESEKTRERAFRKAADAFRRAAQPHIEKMGFTGEYPHYRRIRHGKAEYISAIVEHEPEALDGGELKFAFMLCASQVKMKKRERKEKILRGISFEETRGTDFFNERPEYSKSGIADCAADPPFVSISVSIIDGETSKPSEETIEKMLKCIKRAMNGFSLKKSERRKRIDKKTRRKLALSAFLSAFARKMPSSNIMCAVVAVLYLWGRTQFDVIANIGVRTAVFPIALAGVATALVRALCYCLRRRNKLWTY